MAVLNIKLPDDLFQQIQAHGVSQQQLEKIMTYLLEEFLHEWVKLSPEVENPAIITESEWPDVKTFVQRLIDNNRELFEELSRL